MRMDLTKFKYVSSDGKTTTLKHPRGHSFTIAHSMLEPEHRALFDAMAAAADGGKGKAAKDDKKAAAEAPSESEDAPEQRLADGGPATRPSNSPPDVDPEKAKAYDKSYNHDMSWSEAWGNIKQGVSNAINGTDQQKAQGGVIKRMADGGDTGDGSGQVQTSEFFNDNPKSDSGPNGPSATPAAAKPTAPVTINIGTGAPAQPQAPMGATVQGQESPAGAPQAQPVAAPVPNAPPVPQGPPPPGPSDAPPAGEQAPQAAAPVLVPPQAPADANGVGAEQHGLDPWTQAAHTALSGIGMQQAGAEQQYQAERDLAEHRQDTLSGQQDMLRRMASDYQTKAQDIDQASQHFMQAFQNQNIDPKRYINNMSTGGKIATAIGLIAGGLGAAYNGGHNYAQDFLNKQIDNDIEAQKVNLGKNSTLLEANFRRFGNLRDATQMTKAMNLDLISSMLERDAAMSGDQAAKGRLLDTSGKLQQQKAEIQKSVAMNQMLLEASRSGHPDAYLGALRVVAPDKAKEIEGRYVPGVGIASVPVPDKSREEIGLRQQLSDATAHLRKWASTRSGDLSPTDRAYGQAMANSVQDLYRRANGQGVFREAEADFVKGIVADNPTAFFNKIRVLPKYKALEDSNRAALNGVKRQYGLPTQANINFTPKGQ